MLHIMNRRQLLLSLAALATAPVMAHTPFRQWAIFRQRFLLITTTRDDTAGDELGEEIARILLRRLSASHAQVSRARDWRIQASLLVTRQTEIAVMAHGRADALLAGAPPYQDYGPAPLRVIAQTAEYKLVCRDDFPEHHAYLLSEALVEEGRAAGFNVPAVPGEGGVPAHSGALRFARGEALPVVPDNEKEVRRAQ